MVKINLRCFFTHPTGKIAVGGDTNLWLIHAPEGIFGTTQTSRAGRSSWFNTRIVENLRERLPVILLGKQVFVDF